MVATESGVENNKKITAEQAQFVKDFLKNINFKIEFSKRDEQKLKNGELTNEARCSITKARNACTAAIDDSDKVLNGFDAKTDRSKSAKQTLVTNKKALVAVL